MARIGSDSGLVGNNSGGVFDDSGNPIVTADTEFGASPLGIAARSQALYFLPNPSFNILPPDPSSPIVDNANALPYWSVEDLSEGRMFATTVFDETAQTWALEIDPTAGSATDSIAIKTRSYLLNDSNFDLRQKALASLEKVNAYAGTTQWALTLSAEYFDATNTSLSAFTIGTAADNATWTSLSGFTTSGTAIVDAAAQYVDLTFTLTTTAAVTSTVKVHINSILLQTSTAGGAGAQSFLIADTFTSSGNWVRPTGVDYLVALVGSGGGGGGGGGALASANLTNGFIGTAFVTGGGGGAGANWFIVRDVYVGNLGTVSVGIGAGGAGGAVVSYTKAAGTAATGRGSAAGNSGAAGGNSTFGTIAIIGGGNGGQGGQCQSESPSPGGTAGTTSTVVYGGTFFSGGLGGDRGSNASTAIPASGGTASLSAFTLIPYTTQVATVGSIGGTVSGTGGTQSASNPGSASVAGLWGGAGGGGGARVISNTRTVNNTAGTGRNGGGGGGASVAITISGTVVNGTAGNGGAGSAYGGGGGGGGLAASGTDVNWFAAALSLQAGAGASGSTGFITVVYIA